MIEYTQSLEESVALLGMVISEMSRNEAPFNPTTFAVCYEHLAGINPQLSLAIAEAKKTQPRLGATAMALLYRNHVAEAGAASTDAASGDLQRLMRGVARSASETGTSARAFGSTLASLSQALEESDATSTSPLLTPRLNEAADSTLNMQGIVAALESTMVEGIKEVERLRQALERSRIESVTDGLSRLRNRRGFDEELSKTLATPANAGKAHCLVVFDIDHFKRVNDTHGHPVGDRVIETVGQVLARIASGPDIVAARIGGEEFAVVMRSATTAQALQLAEAVRSLVRVMKIKKRGTQDVIATVTVSAGVAACVPGDDPSRLLAAADAALYRSKNAGRDCVTVA